MLCYGDQFICSCQVRSPLFLNLLYFTFKGEILGVQETGKKDMWNMMPRSDEAIRFKIWI